MGRELQKKKKRSSNPKIRMKAKSKRVNPLGNAIIAANWDQKETLSQNYKRLGLTSRLNTATGGVEKLHPNSDSKTSTTNKLAISNAIPKSIEPTEAQIERDPNTGEIIRVIHATSKPNPLNDLLNSDDENEEAFGGVEGQKHEIVRQLEEQASMEAEKKPRKQSTREKEWVERLVAKYGQNYEQMARDMRLNPMQQTSNDIRRRVAKWQAEGGEVANGT